MIAESNKKFVVIVIAILLLLLILSLVIFSRTSRQAVTFNIKSTYITFLRQASAHNLPQQKVIMLGRIFPKALTMATNAYVKKHNVVIYSQNAVIAGAKDVTKDIQLLIKQDMQNLIKNEKKHG